MVIEQNVPVAEGLLPEWQRTRCEARGCTLRQAVRSGCNPSGFDGKAKKDNKWLAEIRPEH